MQRDPDSELCSSPKIDAMFNTADGSTYAFKGDNYYKLTENAVADGYPKKIAEGWPGLKGELSEFRLPSFCCYFILLFHRKH